MANRRNRRKYTEAFKAETIRLVRESGKPISAVAREMDLTESSLRQWVKDADQAGRRSGALTTPERRELEQLRRDVRTLRMERDILKNYRARHGPSHLLDQKLGTRYADVRPGAVAVRLMVTSRAREKTWSGGGWRT